MHVYKRTMVGRIRDFRGSVVNPKDHFVLPNKQKLSRSDVRDILSDPSVWRGNRAEAPLQLQSLIPQFLDYMVSPWKGAPTVAKKVRGGAPGLEAFAGNPALASRLTDHYARRKKEHGFENWGVPNLYYDYQILIVEKIGHSVDQREVLLPKKGIKELLRLALQEEGDTHE